MSYDIFFTSDLHLGHQNMCSFLNYDGSRVRNFDDFEECDELMIQNWNKIVKSNDNVYILGDVCCGAKKPYVEDCLKRLNGTKVLIRGNHDLWALKWYALFFKDVRGCHNLENYLMTHIPVHPDSKTRFKMNIHGHTHGNYVCSKGERDFWYRNVCMDANNYQVIPFETIKQDYELLQKNL